MITTALTIAGSDSSGGAGIQADLKTFHTWGVYGMSVITAVTAQNTVKVSQFEAVSAALVENQLSMVISDLRVDAVKTGMLANADIVNSVAAGLSRLEPLLLVIDPVMISTSGKQLLDDPGVAALQRKLLPLASLITPNLAEAGLLAGMEVNSLPTMKKAAREIHKQGPKGVLVKGGHLQGEAVDILFWKGDFLTFSTERLSTNSTHGTGCTYSAAIAANLARGMTMTESIRMSKAFIFQAIKTGFKLGKGRGPLNHFQRVVT